MNYEKKREKVKVATKTKKETQITEKQTGNWQNVFWVLLEIPLAQGSQVFLQYNISKLQWSNIFRIFISPKSTLKLSVTQWTGKWTTFSYTENTMSIGGPEVSNCIPIHISLQCHHPVHLQSCSLLVSQFFFTAWALPGTRGTLTEKPSFVSAQGRKRIALADHRGLWYKANSGQTTSMTLHVTATQTWYILNRLEPIHFHG